MKSVRQLACASQDVEPPEPSAISRKDTKVLGPIRKIRFTQSTLRQASIRENEGPSLAKNTRQNSSSAKSLRREKFEDRSQEETARQQRCAQSKAWNLASNIQAQRERQGYILLAKGRVCISCYINKGAEGKIVCGRFRSKYAYGQRERPSRCRVGDHEDVEEVRRR